MSMKRVSTPSKSQSGRQLPSSSSELGLEGTSLNITSSSPRGERSNPQHSKSLATATPKSVKPSSSNSTTVTVTNTNTSNGSTTSTSTSWKGGGYSSLSGSASSPRRSPLRPATASTGTAHNKTKTTSNVPKHQKDSSHNANTSVLASSENTSVNSDLDDVLRYDTSEYIKQLLAKHGVSQPEPATHSDEATVEDDQHNAAIVIQRWWRKKRKLRDLLQQRKTNFDKSMKLSNDKANKSAKQASKPRDRTAPTAKEVNQRDSDVLNSKEAMTHKKAEAARKIQRWYRIIRKRTANKEQSVKKVRSMMSTAQPVTTSARADDKVKDLLSYLEEVEKEAESIKPLPSHKTGFNNNPTTPKVKTHDVELKAKFVALEVEMDDKTKTIQILEKALRDQKLREQDLIAQSQQSEKRKLAIQKKELEEVIARHLAFIDTLLKDKQALNTKCETLATEIKDLQKHHDDKLKEAEESYSQTLKKQKLTLVNAEKTKRDTWIAEKTKEIKEMTIKGLEPEIQKIISKQKQEQVALRDQFEMELRKQREQLTNSYESQLKELRDQLYQEKNIELDRERGKAHIRSLELNQQMEIQLNNIKKGLTEEFRLEKLQYEDKLRKLAQDHDRVTEVLKTKLSQEKEELKLKHEKEILLLCSKWETEKQQIIDTVTQKLNLEFKEKQDVLAKQLSKERDQEIEMVISRLEEESTASQRHLESKYQEKVRSARHSCKTAEAKLQQSEQHQERLEERVSHLERELDIKNKELSSLRNECVNLKQQYIDIESATASQFNQQLAIEKEKSKELELQLKKHKELLIATEQKCKEEMSSLSANIAKQKDKEIEMLHARVRSTIAKRDETIQSLTEELHLLQAKTKQQEVLLEKQRTKLLK